VHTEEINSKTTFKITLKSCPPVVEDGLEARSSQHQIHENLRLFLDVIEEGFLEVFVYLGLDVDRERFPGACELANYVNSGSNSGYVQVFDEVDGLIIRVKVASSAFTPPSDKDLYHLFASSLAIAYQAFDLFYLFSTSEPDPPAVINAYESDVLSGSHSDSGQDGSPTVVNNEKNFLKEDYEIRYKVSNFSMEFRKIISGLEDSNYWEEKLNYSIESLKFFDHLVEDLWPEDPPSPNNIDSIVAVFGSYIAETLMHALNGRWMINSDGAWGYVAAVGEDQPDIEIYPFVWMRKRFDEGDLISAKYDSFKAFSKRIAESNLVNAKTSAVRSRVNIDQLSDLLDLSAKGPNTDANAVPNVMCNVINHRVVLIKEGSIRGAGVKNLFFLLADQGEHFRHDAPKRISVKCYWYHWKPKTSWMGISVKEGAYEIIENYTGEVVVNFGRP
jgi:hypothetical protein